jgi:hypothetical protein
MKKGLGEQGIWRKNRTDGTDDPGLLAVATRMNSFRFYPLHILLIGPSQRIKPIFSGGGAKQSPIFGSVLLWFILFGLSFSIHPKCRLSSLRLSSHAQMERHMKIRGGSPNTALMTRICSKSSPCASIGVTPSLSSPDSLGARCQP